MIYGEIDKKLINKNMKTIKVKNINGIPNQFEIETKEGIYFQSYNSIIAFIPNSNYSPELNGLAKGDYRTQIDEDYWDYSRATGTYRNIFLGEDKKETEKKIKDNQYLLIKLN